MLMRDFVQVTWSKTVTDLNHENFAISTIIFYFVIVQVFADTAAAEMLNNVLCHGHRALWMQPKPIRMCWITSCRVNRVYVNGDVHTLQVHSSEDQTLCGKWLYFKNPYTCIFNIVCWIHHLILYVGSTTLRICNTIGFVMHSNTEEFRNGNGKFGMLVNILNILLSYGTANLKYCQLNRKQYRPEIYARVSCYCPIGISLILDFTWQKLATNNFYPDLSLLTLTTS